MPLDATAGLLPGLATTALRSLVPLFASVGHQPSDDQWAAITDLLEHLELAANGELDRRTVYLSAIPAGTGKTTSIQAFAAALVMDPAYAHVGMVVAVNRTQEVKDMARALEAHRNRLCVICSDLDGRAAGAHLEADGAQIVVTTQAALKETLRVSADFDSATRYHYQGQRRAVMVWDESIAFNRPVALDSDTVLGLAKALRRQSHEARDALLEWSLSLSRHPGGACVVPDFGSLGVDFTRLEQDAESDALMSQAKALGVISGGQGWVAKDNRATSAAVITHFPELPPSLLPLIVTDASAARGVHHASYDQMATQRRVVRLKEAPKSYGNLTIRTVPTAASRSTYLDRTSTKGRDLIDMAVSRIRAVAPEPVLVVSYKSRMAIKGVREWTIMEAINARLTDAERGRVRHLHWGAHTATNDFRDHRQVILTGLNFLPVTATHAASAAALNKPMRTADPSDHPSPEQVEAMRLGMLRDSTLQAILRGNARLSVEGDCGPMEALIFQTRQTGLSDADYRGMFPGVVLVEDRAMLPMKPLKGNLRRLAEIVQRRLEAGETETTDASL